MSRSSSSSEASDHDYVASYQPNSPISKATMLDAT
jgi:hypothetical protein